MEKIQKVIEKAQALLGDLNKRPDAKQNNKLLAYLTDQKLNTYKNAQLYKLKGIAIQRKGVYTYESGTSKKALSYFKKSIDVYPHDVEVYEQLGRIYRQLKKLKDSLKNYNSAIAINPMDPSLYIGRARTFNKSHALRERNKDLEKAVKINPKDPKAYYFRSSFWKPIDETKSMKDLAIAVKLDSQPKASSYVHLGDYFLTLKKYDLAFEYYNQAIDKNPSLDLWEMDMFVFIFNALSVVDNYKRKKIYEVCAPATKLIDAIRTLLDYYDYEGTSIVHFTKLSVADILFASDDNKMRFYHASYMNDPEEGKILLQIFGDTEITNSFSRAEMNIESIFYLGSFLPVQHADELVMWRTYGKDEQGSEAKGCSIVVAREFFDIENPTDKPVVPNSKELKTDQGNKLLPQEEKDKQRQSRVRFDTSLRKVIYFNKNTKKILGEDGLEIKRKLMELRNQLLNILAFRDPNSTKENKLNAAIDRIVYNIVTELRYYFKSADYSYENEERVILSVPPRSDYVKIEDAVILPKRLYVEAKNPVRKHIKKIILGPRVIQPERWSYLKVKMIKNDFDVELAKSNCKFQ